ncbi:uncharacterized protein SCHCODRAFT_02173469 [Schizophyllum commune H4-8]|uniref:uncharacterized protein n=1 Tax=Schizophyllum commune (strain H4-8 / FGSC 9210) TaxID=578458 RepID=UPI002160099B|nr:uncharacterized protein SCHCODRAFT_02173469 [Schizophyllum commune H4-8]KAI5898768.1 hypothetical protein SCHCODRAFT_02173469 [Schizophyllum commune H4-8]
MRSYMSPLSHWAARSFAFCGIQRIGRPTSIDGSQIGSDTKFPSSATSVAVMSNRIYWRQYFHDPPGYKPGATRDSELFQSNKLRIYCRQCLAHHVAIEKQADVTQVASGARQTARTEEEIQHWLWTLNAAGKTSVGSTVGRYGSIRSDRTTIVNHLLHCPYQSSVVRMLAGEDKATGLKCSNEYLEMRRQQLQAQDAQQPTAASFAPSGFLCAPAPQPPPPISVSSLGPTVSLNSPVPSQTNVTSAAMSGASDSASHVFPASPTPSAMSSASSGDHYAPDFSHSPSPLTPGAAAASFLAHSSYNRLQHSTSMPNMQGPTLPLPPVPMPIPAPAPAPPPLFDPKKFMVMFSPKEQEMFEEWIVDLTASCGFQLSWVDNPVWIRGLAMFLPGARNPSRHQLVRSLLPAAIDRVHKRMRAETQGKSGTLQEDGWTGVDGRYLLAFMITVDGKVYTVRVHDGTSEPRSAEHLAELLEAAVKECKEKYGVDVIAICTDASGESRKARSILAKRFPGLVLPDCYAHQIQLVVGDYFDSDSDVAASSTQAEELITWLRSKSLLLGLIRQFQLDAKPPPPTVLTIIRACLTRWTSHYLAFSRLLQLRKVIENVIAKDKYDAEQLGGKSCIIKGKKEAKEKAKKMIALINSGEFWHDVLRMTVMTEPLAIASNITQSTHCTLDSVLLTLGRLVILYNSQKMQETDAHGSKAIIASIETRWSKCDQIVFIIAIILNPFYRTAPFCSRMTIPNNIYPLVKKLYIRFFGGDSAPASLYNELISYLNNANFYASLPDFVESLRADALAEAPARPDCDLERLHIGYVLTSTSGSTRSSHPLDDRKFSVMRATFQHFREHPHEAPQPPGKGHLGEARRAQDAYPGRAHPR